jgi:hypothetical protein
MNKKLKLIFIDKKKYKIILYLLLFIVFFFFIYIFIPKFFNYTPKLVQESLKKNNDVNIKYVSNINYKLFPSPRLRLSGVDLEFGENILRVENTEVDIVFNLSKIINYKTIDYNKFILRGGSTSVKIDKVNKLFDYIKKNKSKINFKNNTIILLKENKRLFEINDSLVKFNTKNNTHKLSINGLFLNHKTFFILKDEDSSKINISLKVPKLDISTNILLKNIDNYKILKGTINFEVLNNFFQFNLIKEKNITINKGFIRSSLINSTFKGEVTFKPYFLFNLDIQPSLLDMKKLILIIKKNFFSENLRAIKTIKKIDGSLNIKGTPKRKVVFKNTEILLQNFVLDKEKKISFNAQISELGTKGKIRFNLINDIKKIHILGFIIPSSSKVNFEKIIFEKEIFTEEKVNKHEKEFEIKVIQNSLVNIFNEKKINNFFETF